LCEFESGLRQRHFKIVAKLTPRKEAHFEVALSEILSLVGPSLSNGRIARWSDFIHLEVKS